METSKLSSKLIEAYEQQDVKSLNTLIAQGLELAAKTDKDWNKGNLLHQIHTISGLLLMDENEILKAKEQLIKSIKVPKSPQLKGFGPNMLLAKRLLEKGETEIVLEYLDLSQRVWSIIPRFFHLRKWRNEIKQNQIPNFNANLRYHLTGRG